MNRFLRTIRDDFAGGRQDAQFGLFHRPRYVRVLLWCNRRLTRTVVFFLGSVAGAVTQHYVNHVMHWC